MAKQTAFPPLWNDSMSDGCTGVPDWLPFVGSMKDDCIQHDKRYHYGGDEDDKLAADEEFRRNIENNLDGLSWWQKAICWPFVKACAAERYIGVRLFGKRAFNWEGPGMPDGVD